MSIQDFNLETYKVDRDLSFSMAYEKQTKLHIPANGGLRFCKYSNEKCQEDEAMILAKHMSQKHMIYNTGFSGVKIVANGDINTENKKKLLSKVGEILNQFQGMIYTGCDMNINNDDMDYLYTISPYVLNAIGSSINTSESTAYGVYGALMAVFDAERKKDAKPKKIIIHGIGKIGIVLAKKLIERGHVVYTVDTFKKNADIVGAINISDDEDWFSRESDYILLCSASNIITPENAEKINSKWIVSSANHPFSSLEVVDILARKKINWIPDVVSNAGAVICDSFEYKMPEKYRSVNPEELYQFVFNTIYKKTNKLLAIAKDYNLRPDQALDAYFEIANNPISGDQFIRGNDNE